MLKNSDQRKKKEMKKTNQKNSTTDLSFFYSRHISLQDQNKWNPLERKKNSFQTNDYSTLYMAPVNSLTHIIFHLCIKSSVKYALNQKI